jgi:hypothetical protein
VLRRLPDVTLERKPRMADFARILAAVDAELGTDTLKRYASQAAYLAAEGLSGDLFAARIRELITSEWEGTSAQLLALVTPAGLSAEDWKAPKEWPKGRGMSPAACGASHPRSARPDGRSRTPAATTTTR